MLACAQIWQPICGINPNAEPFRKQHCGWLKKLVRFLRRDDADMSRPHAGTCARCAEAAARFSTRSATCSMADAMALISYSAD